MNDEIEISVELPQDADGFFSCQCPHCGDRFKLRADEFQEEDPRELACAICGMMAPADEFKFTDEVRRAAIAKAKNVVADHVEDMLDDMQRGLRHSPIQFKKKGGPKRVPPPKLREFVDLADAELPCCEAHVRVPPSVATSTLYCPYCFNIQR